MIPTSKSAEKPFRIKSTKSNILSIGCTITIWTSRYDFTVVPASKPKCTLQGSKSAASGKEPPNAGGLSPWHRKNFGLDAKQGNEAWFWGRFNVGETGGNRINPDLWYYFRAVYRRCQHHCKFEMIDQMIPKSKSAEKPWKIKCKKSNVVSIGCTSSIWDWSLWLYHRSCVQTKMQTSTK